MIIKYMNEDSTPPLLEIFRPNGCDLDNRPVS